MIKNKRSHIFIMFSTWFFKRSSFDCHSFNNVCALLLMQWFNTPDWRISTTSTLSWWMNSYYSCNSNGWNLLDYIEWKPFYNVILTDRNDKTTNALNLHFPPHCRFTCWPQFIPGVGMVTAKSHPLKTSPKTMSKTSKEI